MPWKVFPKDDKYCVHKLTDDGGKGEEVACHDSEEQATAQLRALYAEENTVRNGLSHLFGNAYRFVNQGGKEFVVVPGIPLREQVMNNYLVPAEEIARSVRGWNGIAVSINHPHMNDGSVNVPAPDVAIIGRFFNARYDEEKKQMTGEYWIELAEAMKYVEGKRVVEAIKSNQILETSTGYWADEEKTAGVFDGRDYQTIHRNLLGDHIAILPETVGACSVKDGCGVNRNQAISSCNCDCPFKNAESNQVIPEYQEGHLPRVMLEPYTLNKGARTAEQLESLRGYIKEHGIDKPVILMRMEDGEIKILDGNHRVAMAGEFGIDQIPVKIVNENLLPIDPEMMYRQWQHQEDQGYLNQVHLRQAAALKKEKESNMDLKKLQETLKAKGIALTVNEAGDYSVEETPAPASETLSAEEIAALKTVLVWFAKLGNSQEIDQVAQNLKDIPTAIRLAQNIQAQEKAERDQLVATIKANSANPYSEEELSALPTAVLTKLNAQLNVSFAGLAGAQVFENVAEPLRIPAVMLAPYERGS